MKMLREKGSPDGLFVPMRSRRLKRALALQQINHAVPAAGLIYAGLAALRQGAEGFELALAIVEILTSVVLIAALARSIHAARASTPANHGAHGINWVDIWAAAVLLAEVFERWHARHHIARPILLTALFTLALGLFHRRVAAFRERAAGFVVRRRPFRRRQ